MTLQCSTACGMACLGQRGLHLHRLVQRYRYGIPGAAGQGCQAYLENTTSTLFEQYTRLPAHPQIAIMIGFPGQPSALTDGRLRDNADQVWVTLVHHQKYGSIYFRYLHHPLLIVYTGTPTPFPHGLPPFFDPRFTVRFLTGFVSEQPPLLSV